ncbi:MAG: ATP-grasp domain-containing protein [Oscillospiraceae bacterium]|nr:ATP-grasp domain-containing protein [Oscillospiraceae bacterium]
MKTVVITDGKYRSALAAARDLGRRGFRVVVTQTRAESPGEPPVFSSRFAEGVWVEGSAAEPSYPDRLLTLLSSYDRPALFCVGAGTLNVVASERARFAEEADFLIADSKVLDALNDKQQVHERALELELPVPRQYTGKPERYPVILKPHCGEKLGLKAAERYTIARDEAQFQTQYAAMRRLDPEPIVQELIRGPGRGVSLLLGRDSQLLGAICHRRLREYPMGGGPSTCCVSEYDAARIESACRLLQSFGFVGLAMVEFKGEAILEVNPRIWGSFPLVSVSGSPLAEYYVRAAGGENVDYQAADYEIGKKMRFCLNDIAAAADLLRHGKLKAGCSGLLDFFRVREALRDSEDKTAFRNYLKSYFR